MNYLAIDTSGSGLAVVASGRRLSKRYKANCQLSHSVILMDEIEESLKEAGITLKDVDVFACVVGPGSFTGIRIGVSTAKAFSYAEKKPVLPLTSFQVMAYNAESAKQKLTLIDARHGNYYACGFSSNNEVILPPRFINESELGEYSSDFEFFTDTESNYSPCDGIVKAVEANLQFATSDREQLVPLYVKKSQAEEEL